MKIKIKKVSIQTRMNTFFPIQDGKMVMSSTQTIYFLEFDGPLYRTLLHSGIRRIEFRRCIN